MIQRLCDLCGTPTKSTCINFQLRDGKGIATLEIRAYRPGCFTPDEVDICPFCIRQLLDLKDSADSPSADQTQ